MTDVKFLQDVMYQKLFDIG